MNTNITLNAREFYTILRDLKYTTSVDIHAMDGINLHVDKSPSGDTILVGTSTDRMVFAQAHAAATGEGDPLFFASDFVEIAFAALKHIDDYVLNAMIATIEADDATITLTVTDSSTSTRFSAKRAHQTLFEAISRKFGFIQDPTDGSGPIELHYERLEVLAKVAKDRGKQIVFHPSYNNTAQHIQIGDNYRALVMPCKAGNSSLPPIYLPASVKSAAAA